MGWFTWIHRKWQPGQKVSPAATKRDILPEDELYMLPKDGQEINRLDFQHYLLRSTLKTNHLAPLISPSTILDVGCGTGRWMLEMSETFPHAQIVGVDLSPPVRESNPLSFSANCHFHQGNVLKGLPFKAHQFAFVHQRLLMLAIPLARWPGVIQELVRIAQPGGWIELVEADLNIHNQGKETARLVQWIARASQQRGLDLSIGRKIGSLLRDARLLHCQVYTVTIPLGNWGGRLGSLLLKDFYAATQALKPLVMTTTGVSLQTFDHTVQAWLRECEIFQTTCDFYFTYGQTPL